MAGWKKPSHKTHSPLHPHRAGDWLHRGLRRRLCCLTRQTKKHPRSRQRHHNGDLINLYRVAANHPTELARIVGTFPPASRVHIIDSREILARPAGATDVLRAAHFLHLNKTSFAGSGTSLAITVAPDCKGFIGIEALIARIHTFHSRFNSVIIECQSYEKILTTYDHPRNFLFLDPPYGGNAVKNYPAWGEAELTAFRDRVIRLRGNWIVTLNDSPLNRSLWAGHDIDFCDTRSGSGNQRQPAIRKFGEMFIYSPNLRSKDAAA